MTSKKTQKNPKSFVFYESFFKGISAIADHAVAYDVYRGLIEYGLYGTLPEDISDIAQALVIAFGYQIDIAKEKHAVKVENGKKGGRPKKAKKTEPKAKKPNENENENENMNENMNENVYGAFGNVTLSPDEFSKLSEKFPDCSAKIERLSAYKASTGKAYASDYATLLLWAERDAPELDDDTKKREQMLDESLAADVAALWADAEKGGEADA